MKYPEIEFEPFFTWSNRPRILFSPGVRSEIGFEMTELFRLNQIKSNNVVIITDKGIVDAGVADMVIEEVEKSDLKLVGIFDKIIQDARIDLINEGAEYYRKVEADAMIVVGGGSVMDSAKGINILIGSDKNDFQPLAEQGGLWDDARPLPPHIALPTTAGTASEVTHAIVALDPVEKVKLQITHPYNADVAMLDPELTVKLPPKLTAFTGMDALTHAIESITSTGAEPIADALGLHAIRLIFKYLPICVKEPENIIARGYMLIASTMGGMCFGNTQLGAVHSTAHSLGAHYGIPHGLGNAIMLPHVMEYNIEESPERYMMIADAMGINVNDMNPLEASMLAIQAVRDLNKEIGITETLSNFDVPNDKEKLMPTVELCAGDSQLSYNPRYLEEEDILNILLKAI